MKFCLRLAAPVSDSIVSPSASEAISHSESESGAPTSCAARAANQAQRPQAQGRRGCGEQEVPGLRREVWPFVDDPPEVRDGDQTKYCAGRHQVGLHARSGVPDVGSPRSRSHTLATISKRAIGESHQYGLTV